MKDTGPVYNSTDEVGDYAISGVGTHWDVTPRTRGYIPISYYLNIRK